MPREAKPLPCPRLLRAMFEITDDFRLVNKVGRTSRRKGGFADCHLRRGYRSVFVDGRLQFAHRLIWVMVLGREPNGILDHINNDKLDNRIENLRDASHCENMQNRKVSSHNTSGTKGVHRRRDNGKWRAYISKRGVRKELGSFDRKNDAIHAVELARKNLHGAFARAG